MFISPSKDAFKGPQENCVSSLLTAYTPFSFLKILDPVPLGLLRAAGQGPQHIHAFVLSTKTLHQQSPVENQS